MHSPSQGIMLSDAAFVGYAIKGILKPILRERNGWNYHQASQSVS